MNLDYLLLRSEWAVEMNEGLNYLMQAYSEAAYLGDKFLSTMADRKAELGKISVSYGGIGADMFDNVESITSGVDGTAVVQLSGAMTLEDGLCHTGIKSFSKTLRALDQLDSITGIVIEVNSGGGEAAAGQLLYSTVKDLKTKTGALVHMAGSAAYMGIAPADFIMTVGDLGKVGSIGVLYTIDRSMLEEIKENYKTIYSDLSPQKNIETRELLEGMDSGIKRLLNNTAESFQNMVMDNRILSYKKADTLEGGVFSGKEARKRGLIDYIGSYNQALKRISKLN